MAKRLDYARPDADIAESEDNVTGRAAFFAMMFGLCSGPAVILLACVGLATGLERTAFVGSLLVLGGAFIFGISAALELPQSRRDRIRVIIAVLAPILWAGAILFLIAASIGNQPS